MEDGFLRDSNNKNPTFDEIKNAIKKATKAAVGDLFEIDEDFYYLVLATSGDARLTPYLCACSTEGLAQTVSKHIEKYGNEEGLEESLRWSSADSPYALFRFDEYFKDLENLYFLRQSNVDDDDDWIFYSKAMILALKELDIEDVFERKTKRKNLLINIAPDHLNLKSTAFILNDTESLQKAIEDNVLEDDAEWLMDDNGNLHVKAPTW
jgi:hypothetical protein